MDITFASFPGIEFIKPALPVVESDRQRLEPSMKSWRTLSVALRTMNEVDCLKVYAIERAGACRPVIMYRALSRFRVLRNRRENREIRP